MHISILEEQQPFSTQTVSLFYANKLVCQRSFYYRPVTCRDPTQGTARKSETSVSTADAPPLLTHPPLLPEWWTFRASCSSSSSAVSALPSNQARLTSRYFPALGARVDNWQRPVKYHSDAFSLSKNFSHLFVSEEAAQRLLQSRNPRVHVWWIHPWVHLLLIISILNYVRHTTFIALKQSRLYHIYNSHWLLLYLIMQNML